MRLDHISLRFFSRSCLSSRNTDAEGSNESFKGCQFRCGKNTDSGNKRACRCSQAYAYCSPMRFPGMSVGLHALERNDRDVRTYAGYFSETYNYTDERKKTCLWAYAGKRKRCPLTGKYKETCDFPHELRAVRQQLLQIEL